MATGRVDKGMTRYLAHPLICRQPMQPDLFILIPLFAFIAFVYSSVGLGGGSSYTAVLTIVGMSYMLIPTISLALNIVVTTGATFQFLRNGHLRWRVLLPLLMASVPAAWIGGRLQLPETTFQLLLLLTLIAVAVRIYLWKDPVFDLPSSTAFRLAASLVIGAVLGFVAGAVGIGGGIYLVPVLIMTGVATTREAAATGAAFILFNSVTGVLARASWTDVPWKVLIPLGVTVALAGLAGSHYGSSRWPSRTIQRVLGVVILVAIALLIQRLLTG